MSEPHYDAAVRLIDGTYDPDDVRVAQIEATLAVAVQLQARSLRDELDTIQGMLGNAYNSFVRYQATEIEGESEPEFMARTNADFRLTSLPEASRYAREYPTFSMLADYADELHERIIELSGI